MGNEYGPKGDEALGVSSFQFDKPFNTRFSEVVGLLKEAGFRSLLKLSFGGLRTSKQDRYGSSTCG